MKATWLGTMLLAVVIGWGGRAAAEEYEVGGPLAGVKLPPFPTQHGEPPGYPGCLPDPNDPTKRLNEKEGLSPELHLHPDSVEHWRANDFKYLPTRSLYDRQSLVKNWKAADLAVAGKAPVEEYAEPVYWVRRHADPVMLDKRRAPAPVVRCRPRAPVFELAMGELERGMYVLSVVAAVETKDLIRHRKPVYLRVQVNDGLGGEVSTYRQRLGYCDQFYSVAEVYFHAPEKRAYRATMCTDEGSVVDLLVHNVELHDVLAGRTRRALKTRMTMHDPERAATPAAGAQPAADREARWARDQELWNDYPPINAQRGINFGGGGDDGLSNRPRVGAGGKTPQEIEAEWGAWTPGKGAVLMVNGKLRLTYTLADLAAHRPLPDPYPYKDDGCGLWFAPEKPDAVPQNWLPVAHGVSQRERDLSFELSRALQAYAAKADVRAGRDAAVLLCRYAYDFPSDQPVEALSAVMLQPGAYGKDWRCRHRRTAMDGDRALDAYDALFNVLRDDSDLAASIGRFVPWVKVPKDVIELLDVYLVQDVVKRYMRYQGIDANNPAKLATIAALVGDPAVTDPWMEWVFTRTWMYPLSVSGLADMIVSGTDRDGIKCIGSYYYGHVEECSKDGEIMEAFIRAGGNPKYDLRDARRYPKVQAACYWFLRSRVAGMYFPRIGDVTGPSAGYGAWFNLLEAPFRRGWRWTHDPKFAFMLKEYYGRKGESDAEWAELEQAAAGVRRAPWLDQRSRVLSNWFGVLESGLEHDDFRFRRSALLRIGQGHGHAHSDTLDLQIHAHGLPMTVDGGMRPGYSKPGDARSRVHNLVEVDGRDWLGHAWVTALSDAEGARYLAAESVPPSSHPQVKLYRRQLALIDVDEGQGSRPLTSREQAPGFSGLDAKVTTASSYVFDVVRVEGGRTHTYCFHGPCEDEFTVNVEKRLPLAETAEADKAYLAPFPMPEQSWAADAPETVAASWRYTRFEGTKPFATSNGYERLMARCPWSEDLPRKYTRLYVPGQAGARLLSGQYFCRQGGHRFTNLYVQHRAEADTSAVFPAVIEPYAGEPFIEGIRLLEAVDNEADARRAVALEVRTKNGHRDVLFADGRPDRMRDVKRGAGNAGPGGGGEPSPLRIGGEFACYSTDGQGLRLAALTGGTLLAGPEAELRPAARERTGKVVRVDYAGKALWIDRPWPAGALLKGRVFEVGSPPHMTTYTLTGATADAQGSALSVLGGAEYYLARVLDVEAEKGLVHCSLGFAVQEGNPCPGLDRHWVASNEERTKFWRAEYLGGDRSAGRYTFRVETPGAVAMEDFGRTKGFALWEYGVGDTVRQSTFAGLRRVQPGVFELTTDVDVTVALAGETMEAGRDGAQWRPLETRKEGARVSTLVRAADLSPEGKLLIRVR